MDYTSLMIFKQLYIMTIGDLKKNGYNIYTVKLFNLNEFYPWDAETPDNVMHCVLRKLNKLGADDLIETITREYEEYGTYWTIVTLYSVLTHTLGNTKAVSEWLNICGCSGVIGDSPAHNGKVYTVYDDSYIKILNVEKLR